MGTTVLGSHGAGASSSCDHERLRTLAPAGGYDDKTGLEPLSRVDLLGTLILRSKRVEELSPLAVLPLEHLTLDGCHDSSSRDAIDLAPLERIPTLRTVGYRRFARVRGAEHPVLTAFDNARVIQSLEELGVALAFER
ncbi:hypothetical protein [Streptomyces sp. NPDC001876]|uniref:hypothetical protein n=1 Tax=Streptomyces sp. NPDC001876 TaxID=3154402 RepID=UPI00332B90FD